GRERTTELVPVENVLARDVPAGLGRSERTPGDAIARRIEARKGPFQAAHLGKRVLLRTEHIVHHDLAGDRGAQSDLAVDRWRGEAASAFVQDESADRPLVVLGPDDEHVSEG